MCSVKWWKFKNIENRGGLVGVFIFIFMFVGSCRIVGYYFVHMFVYSRRIVG